MTETSVHEVLRDSPLRLSTLLSCYLHPVGIPFPGRSDILLTIDPITEDTMVYVVMETLKSTTHLILPEDYGSSPLLLEVNSLNG